MPASPEYTSQQSRALSQLGATASAARKDPRPSPFISELQFSGNFFVLVAIGNRLMEGSNQGVASVPQLEEQMQRDRFRVLPNAQVTEPRGRRTRLPHSCPVPYFLCNLLVLLKQLDRVRVLPYAPTEASEAALRYPNPCPDPHPLTIFSSSSISAIAFGYCPMLLQQLPRLQHAAPNPDRSPHALHSLLDLCKHGTRGNFVIGERTGL